MDTTTTNPGVDGTRYTGLYDRLPYLKSSRTRKARKTRKTRRRKIRKSRRAQKK